MYYHKALKLLIIVEQSCFDRFLWLTPFKMRPAAKKGLPSPNIQELLWILFDPEGCMFFFCSFLKFLGEV